ncbi:acyltransferase [Pseudoalteromonas sp. JBTF-M23]|uniref:Acyltransferase n=1 Tax=Pseudoalteromonas caenipelagi TaxID=2726988 RepID=A0A849VIZ6_9GAMM|nr:DapH/DapD/GlmU-related protein [Pseudoalteromonas caenipelagi]NOU51794.1 acyltransferase [Pseudoalteromonas caenipelagi]
MIRFAYLCAKVASRLLPISKLQNLTDRLAHQCIMARYRSQGATIGDNCVIINTTLSSSSKGDKFFIGDNCTITGATLLGHDASPTLFLDELIVHEQSYLRGSRRSYRSPITIGNNVFIGWGSIVLPGVHIGDDCVIGAGSVVTRDIPAGHVAAGNPAKVIKPTQEYIEAYRRLLDEKPGNF